MTSESKPTGRIKTTPEDFIVDELPLYPPSGEGEHLFVHFRKRNLTTDEAVQTIAKRVGVRIRDVGVAGLKDKVGVTTQTISLPITPGSSADSYRERIGTSPASEIEILSTLQHRNKLKTGHLAGNQFTIRVTDVDRAALPAVTASFDKIRREGVPNAFGTQRFGHGGNNAELARAWLTGEKPGPRDPRKQRFFWSALQSAMFNDVLSARVENQTWSTALAGDLLQKRGSGGLFLCEDATIDVPRTLDGEVSATGPMFGARMREPEGAPGELERSVFQRWLGDRDRAWLKNLENLGEGARRPLRQWVDDLQVAELPPTDSSGASRTGIQVRFVLPKGCYATVVLSSVFQLDDPKGDRDGS